MCPSDLLVPTGPSLAFSLTTADIEAVVQQVLSRTSTSLFVTPSNNSWFFDTACCNHMTPNESQFSDKAPLAHPTSIYTADGTPMLVSHKGTIYTPSLSLSDTFHIPKLSLNLLSVGQLCVLGVDHMTRNELQFSDKAPLAHPTSIYTTDGTLMLVSHKGIIYTPSLSLSDTFHIPKLSLNLLYVGQPCVLGVDHMTPNESQFSDKTPLAHPTSIYIADGTLMLVSHKGTISTPSLSLSDTFHIPKLSLNLLSVGQLCVLGVDILFTNHGVDVQDPRIGQVLETGCKVGHIFEVYNLKIPSC